MKSLQRQEKCLTNVRSQKINSQMSRNSLTSPRGHLDSIWIEWERMSSLKKKKDQDKSKRHTCILSADPGLPSWPRPGKQEEWEPKSQTAKAWQQGKINGKVEPCSELEELQQKLVCTREHRVRPRESACLTCGFLDNIHLLLA